MEREAYYVRRGQAEMRPKEILSLIIDGMDQNKTDLPHYCKWSNPSVCTFDFSDFEKFLILYKRLNNNSNNNLHHRMIFG